MIKSFIKNVLIGLKLTSKVNLFIIGAQKSGTTTLYDNLVQHSVIFGGTIKEKNFFSHKYLYVKGTAWYYTLFQTKKIFFRWFSNNYYMDASPSYLSSKEVAQKLYAYNPIAKFIIMMRNPIDRAFSAWNMYKQMNLLSLSEKENLIAKHILGLNEDKKEKFIKMINLEKFPTFEEMIEEELFDIINNKEPYPGILKRGIYHEQIENYLTLFKPQQFFYICSEDFKEKKNDILNELFHFLNLEKTLPKSKLEDKHIRVYQSKISPQIREKLKEFYKPHNQKLYALINKNYNWE
jgi:sulfotransferase family protein